jgi:hypothetical protein
MSLHSQGRRERLLRVGEPRPSLIQILRSRHDESFCSQEVVEGFAGLDVSAREISVARRAALVLSTRLESLLTLPFKPTLQCLLS